MNGLESARKKWLVERSAYDLFGKKLAEMLRIELRDKGIWAEVTSRAKEIDSLIRKLIKKPRYSYDTVGDKSGIRVILRYKDEIEPVLKLAEKIFDCGDFEQKIETLEHDQVGYLSVHGDVKLQKKSKLAGEYPPEEFRAELQVRTMAQHLWSEMSHDAFYKNDESLNPLPKLLKRKVYILAGVVEVADNEFNRLNSDMETVPELDLLKSLERHYFKLTTRRSDSELSLDVIRLLSPLYKKSSKQIALQLDQFYIENRDVVHAVYEQAENEPDRSAYLYQPEALMIYERLKADEIGLRKVWTEKYPDRELERIANAFGISFD